MSSPSIDLPSIQTNFAPYLSSTSSLSKNNSNCSSPPHHPQRMPSTPTSASPALSFQSRSFSLTSRFSSSSLHSQYSTCSTSGRSPSASPGPATPCDVLSRSPSFSHDRPISLPHPHHHQQHHAAAAGPHKGSMHSTHSGPHDQAQDKHAPMILSPFSPLPQERERYSHQLPPFHGLPSRQHHHSNHYQPYQSTQHQHQQAQQQQQHTIHPHHHHQAHHPQPQYQQPAHHNSHHVRDSVPHSATASAPTTTATRFRQYSGQQTATSSPYPPQSPLLGRDHVDYSPASSQREFRARMASAPATAPWTGHSASSASTTPSGMMMSHGPGGDYFSRPSTPPSSATFPSSSSFSSYSHHLPTPSTPITPTITKEENQCSSRLVYSPVSLLSISTPPPPRHAPALASVVTAPPPTTTQNTIPSSLSSILSTPLSPTLPHLQVSTRNISTVGQGHTSPFVKNEEYSPAMYPRNHPYAHRRNHHHRRSSTESSDEGQEYSRESSPYTPSEQRQYMQQGGQLHHPYGASPSHHSFIKNERMDSPSSPSSPSSMGNSNGNNNNSSQLLLCPVCSRAFKPSKNQNCNLRRHLKNVHNMSPTMHPRKCKWDSLPDGRVKDDKDRKERTRKSKRLWARKFRQRRKVEEAAVVLSMLSQAL